jgi:hypothetical protein
VKASGKHSQKYRLRNIFNICHRHTFIGQEIIILKTFLLPDISLCVSAVPAMCILPEDFKLRNDFPCLIMEVMCAALMLLI